MRRTTFVLSVLALLFVFASAPAAAGDFGIFGSFWDTDDLGETAGGGVKFSFGDRFKLRAAGTYYPDLTEDAGDLVEDGDIVLIRVAGSHFIWKMVRRMVGVLVEVGTGRLRADAVPELLAEPSGLPAKVTAPASGLFLERVFYAGDQREWPLVPAVAVQAATVVSPGSRARR